MFVQGGYVYPGDALGSVGEDGYYWSSVGLSSSLAYDLTFSSDYVDPSGYYRQHIGFSVRCVALGG